jgi:ribosomal-protein-serine acetyltransferase
MRDFPSGHTESDHVKAVRSLPYFEIDIEPGLKLKQLEEYQADDLYGLTVSNHDHLIRWLPFPDQTHSPEDSRKFIQAKIDDRKHGRGYGYGIELAGRLVGHIEIRNVHDSEKDPEIGYWVIADETGKGLSTKTTIALSKFAAQTLGLHKIIIRARQDNIASNKVAEKAGYTLSHTSEDNEGLWNIWTLTKDS